MELSESTRNWFFANFGIVAIGVVGNILIIIVLCRKTLQQNSSSLIMLCMAVADILCLLDASCLHLVAFKFGLRLHDVSVFLCQVHICIIMFFKDLAAWYLMDLSIERVIAVVMPFRYKRICTRRSAGVTVVITTVVLAGANIFNFNTRTFEEMPDANSTTPRCLPVEDFTGIWTAISLIKSVILPGVIMLVASGIISWSLFRSSRRERGSGDTENRTIVMSKLLLMLNIIFILTSAAPLVYFYLTHSSGGSTSEQTNIGLTVFGNVNHLVNFWFYCYVWVAFRTELKGLCRCSKASVENNTFTRY